MTTSHRCFEHSACHVIVLDGMPGAGKTTTAHALAECGLRVLGEYTSATAATIPRNEHPAVNDDVAHQSNWLRKSAQARALASADTPGPMFVDRDWLSSLAYAYSIADTDDGTLLRERIFWANKHLTIGNLLLPDTYAIFDLDGPTSLHRRSATLRPDHPWSRPNALQRLRNFYRSPLRIIWDICPALADRLRKPRRVDLDGTGSRSHLLTIVGSLGQVP